MTQATSPPLDAAPAFRVRRLRGPGVLRELGEPLDDLLTAAGAPLVARRPWLQTWIETYADHTPWAVVVERSGSVGGGGPGGTGARIEAAALLATRTRRGRLQVVGLGHGPSDQHRLTARSPQAASALGEAVARVLGSVRGAWGLRLEQLPVGDPVAAEVVRRLPTSSMVPGDGSPTLEFDRGREFRSYVSHNSRGVAKTMRNRMRRDGLELRIECLREAERVVAALPEVEAVHRDRDVQLVRRSDLEDPRMARFWRAAIAQHAERGELELVTLRLNGVLAGYVVGLLDHDAYRLWDARFAAEFGWYSPGRVADQAAIASALSEEQFGEFDWMRGVEEYKLRNSNRVVPAEHLVAWSSPAVRALEEWPRRSKASLKRVRDRNEILRKAWLAAKARVVIRERPG